MIAWRLSEQSAQLTEPDRLGCEGERAMKFPVLPAAMSHQRKRNAKSCPSTASLAFCLERSSVDLHGSFGDGEAEAQPTEPTRDLPAPLGKRIKKP